MKSAFSLPVGLLAGLLATSPASAQSSLADREAETFFESRIRPVLAEKCFSCHGPKKQRADLRLDLRDHLFRKGDTGIIVVPGHPENSLLLKVLAHQGEVKMPPNGKLSPEVLADFAAWVKAGAYFPDTKGPKTAAKEPEDAWKNHWAFRPVREPAVPAVRDREKAATPVDAFILEKLEAKGLSLNPPADPRTLLRRLKFDLLGLPVTEAEVAEFEKDHSPAAYARWVDRWLDSPHYGERWARFWLDVARYADTKGYVFQEERRYPFAYVYRDWVVRAFNEDLPYDRFVQLQLAADRLVARKEAEPASQAAMGYLTLGRRFLNNIHDIIDDRLDVVGRGFLGLTVGCARCHDHKYDPIPIRDYYSLYGVFASSLEPKDLPLVEEPARTKEFQVYEAKLQQLQAAVDEFKKKHEKELAANNRQFRNQFRALQKKVDAFRATSPAAPARAMVLVDASAPREPRVFLRGNPRNPGPQVPRQFLGFLQEGKAQPFRDGSGRLELARAITDRNNPLTARVLVNRIWMHHFGTGLVTTPSDFGLRSDPPSHPELLDWLAARFMAEGWSIKKLHRRILLSATWKQSSADDPKAALADPDNRLLARQNRRRLDFEALRDGLLFASGKLDLSTVGGKAVDITKAPFPGRRTIYGFIDRQNLPGLFRTFDFASPDVSTPQRFQTTVPQQALFLLNSPFVQEQARALAARAAAEDSQDPARRIDRLYRLLHARPAAPAEVELALRYVNENPPGGTMNPWERYAQVLLVSNEFAFVD